MTHTGDVVVFTGLTRREVSTLLDIVGMADVRPYEEDDRASIMRKLRKADSIKIEAPHHHCGTVHGDKGCPAGGGNDGWTVSDGEWKS